MESINEMVSRVLFERLYHPTSDGKLVLVQRPGDKPKTATTTPYAPRPFYPGGEAPHTHLIQKRWFMMKSKPHTESILDRFSPKKKYTPDRMAELKFKKKLGDVKDRAVGAARKIDHLNDRVNDWLDTPPDF